MPVPDAEALSEGMMGLQWALVLDYGRHDQHAQSRRCFGSITMADKAKEKATSACGFCIDILLTGSAFSL
jgi:hypothetical protein